MHLDWQAACQRTVNSTTELFNMVYNMHIDFFTLAIMKGLLSLCNYSIGLYKWK